LKVKTPFFFCARVWFSSFSRFMNVILFLCSGPKQLQHLQCKRKLFSRHANTNLSVYFFFFLVSRGPSALAARTPAICTMDNASTAVPTGWSFVKNNTSSKRALFLICSFFFLIKQVYREGAGGLWPSVCGVECAVCTFACFIVCRLVFVLQKNTLGFSCVIFNPFFCCMNPCVFSCDSCDE
jgi:hypothetical protein